MNEQRESWGERTKESQRRKKEGKAGEKEQRENREKERRESRRERTTGKYEPNISTEGKELKKVNL